MVRSPGATWPSTTGGNASTSAEATIVSTRPSTGLMNAPSRNRVAVMVMAMTDQATVMVAMPAESKAIVKVPADEVTSAPKSM